MIFFHLGNGVLNHILAVWWLAKASKQELLQPEKPSLDGGRSK
jgi:hypothetical protein